MAVSNVQFENILDVGDEIPGFDLDSQLGRINFRDVVYGRWCVILTFTQAFEATATTDLGMLGKLKEEFDQRDILVLTIGNDSVPNLRTWARDIEELNSTKVEFPLLCDVNCNVLRMLGCVRDVDKLLKHTSNGVFLIDLDARIRFSSRTSPYVGRNLFEVIRQFDAILMVTFHPIVCPCNWGQGQQVMMRKDISLQEAVEYKAADIKPWFKLAPCPEKI